MKKLITFLFSLPFNVFTYIVKFVFACASLIILYFVWLFSLLLIIHSVILERIGYDNYSEAGDDISESWDHMHTLIEKRFWRWHKYTINKQ